MTVAPIAPRAAPKPNETDDPRGNQEDFGKPHQKTTDVGREKPRREKLDPDEDYSWRRFYERPKWKDFDPTDKLQERLDGAPPPKPRRFRNVTPGEMVVPLIREAKGRGAIDEIKINFSKDKDSSGRRWSRKKRDLISKKFEPGTTILDVVRWLDEQNIAEGRMNGRVLELYPAGHGRDRTDSVMLAKGRNLIDGPEKGSAKEVVTDAYVLSQSGVHGWVSHKNARKRWGRRIEAVHEIDSVRTWEQAEAQGERMLDRAGLEREQLTYGVVPDKGANPYRDYDVGDYVLVMRNGTPSKQRVRRIGLVWGQTSESVAIAVTLGKRLDPPQVKAAKRNRAHDGKSLGTRRGARAASFGSDTDEPDDNSPRPPSRAFVASKAGTMQISWDGRDDTGGTPVWDQAEVEVHVSDEEDFDADASSFITALRGPGTVTVNDLPYNETRFVKLVAVDRGGDRSAPSEEVVTSLAAVTSSDVQPGAISYEHISTDVPMPSPPVVPDSSPVPEPNGVPGSILVRLPPPEDANTPTIVDVYISDTSPVALTSENLHGTATGGTMYHIENLPPDPVTGEVRPLEYFEDPPEPIPADYEPVLKTYYIVAVARSAADPSLVADPSPEVEARMRQVDTPDVSVNAIWAGWVSAGRITSGTTEAQIVLAGVIESHNPSGPEFGRVGLSADSGFYSRGVVPEGGTLDDAPVLVHFPVDGAPNIVSGILEAEKLTVTGGATFRSATSFETEAEVVLEQGTQPPKAGPAAVIGYHTWKPEGITSDVDFNGLAKANDGAWYTTTNDNDTKVARIRRFDSGWSLTHSLAMPTGRDTLGLTYSPNLDRIFVLTLHRSSWDLHTRAYTWDATNGFTYLKEYYHGASSVWNAYHPTIGWNFTNNRLIFAYQSAGGVGGAGAGSTLISEYTVNSAGTLTYFDPSSVGMPGNYGLFDLGGILRGSFDYGADRYVVRQMANDSNDEFRVYTTNLSNPARVSGDEWDSSGQVRGLWWDGTRFFAINGTPTVIQYEGGRSKPGSGSWRWSFDSRWFDSKTTRAITISTTSASPSISASDYVFGTGDNGVPITGLGIPAGTVIQSIVAGSGQATLSQNATATASGVSATLNSTQQETAPSPRTTFTMIPRARVTLTMAQIPVGRGGVNDPDSIRVYFGRGADDASTVMAREKTLAPGVTSMTMNPIAAAEGGVPAALFGNSTPARMKSAAVDSLGYPVIDVRGDGYARIDMLMPPGAYLGWDEAIAPKGWAVCDGSEISQDQSPVLAARWGTGASSRHGAAATGFIKLPDRRGRVMIGAGTQYPLNTTDSTSEANRTLKHTHGASGTLAAGTAGSSHTHGNTNSPNQAAVQRATGTADVAGSGHTHAVTNSGSTHTHDISGATADGGNNAIPYFVGNWIVKL